MAAALYATPALAQTVSEEEPNNSIGTPQVLQFIGESSATVNAALGNDDGINPVENVDFYSFEGTAGDVVTIDIDGPGWVDTKIALFGDGPDYLILRENDDAGDLDDGSVSVYDSRIDDFALPDTGRYYVVVTNWANNIAEGGTVAGETIYSGDYILNISGVTPAVADVPPPVVDVPPPAVDLPPADSEIKQVTLRIFPGRYRRSAPMNPRSNEKIPVVILSTETFDPMSIDQSSLTFGQTGEEASLSRCNKRGIDVNRDGHPDLVCHFRNKDAGFDQYTLEAKLAGQTLDGTKIAGEAPLKVTPHKRSFDGRHHHHDRSERRHSHRASR
jgi:hypothetical protein